MSHTVTSKLNKPAREFANANGVTFFVGLGEKNYDFKQKTNVYTNYDAALFAKDGQIEFYRNALVEGAIISVSGTGLILDVSNAQYPKLMIQDAKLGFVHSPSQGQPQPAPQQSQQSWGNKPQQAPAPQQQAPQMAPAYQPAQQQAYSQAPTPQNAPVGNASQKAQQQNAHPNPSMDFDDDIPF